MIPYIINVGLILSGCIVFYKLLLQKETFYRVNRWVLIVCLLVSFGLPLVPMPQELSLRKATVVNDQTIQPINKVTETSSPTSLTTADNSEISSPISFKKLLSYLVYLYWFGVIA